MPRTICAKPRTLGRLSGKVISNGKVVKTLYKTINDVPNWARPTIQKLIDKKALSGDGKGNINVSEDFCRTFVALDRLGKL